MSRRGRTLGRRGREKERERGSERQGETEKEWGGRERAQGGK